MRYLYALARAVVGLLAAAGLLLSASMLAQPLAPADAWAFVGLAAACCCVLLLSLHRGGSHA